MRHWILIALALTLTVSTGCGEDRLETGCDSDAQCREGRMCDVTTAQCVWIDPERQDTSEAIDVSDLVDVPDEVTDPPASDDRTIEDFIGIWALAANGEISSEQGGTTSYQYDEDWTFEVRGTSDAATVVFSAATVPALTGCEAEGQVRGAGLVFRGGPCRAEGNRLDTFGGVAYFDEFGELTVDIAGNAEELATGFDEVFTFTASGLVAEGGSSGTPAF